MHNRRHKGGNQQSHHIREGFVYKILTPIKYYQPSNKNSYETFGTNWQTALNEGVLPKKQKHKALNEDDLACISNPPNTIMN